MFAELALVAAIQLGPFAQKGPDDFGAVRPFWSHQGETTDVLWPLFTSHRDWWRFAYFMTWQEGRNDAYDFQILPLWFNGRTPEGEDYWGLFPLWGRHPHLLLMDDFEFGLWPLWHRYRTFRSATRRWDTSHAVLWPIVTWRDDGSWGVWPLCGVNHQRESDHRYALWPLVTWADYRADRDTSGAGSSWMFWPLCGGVTREREDQWLFLPPLFSYTRLQSSVSGKATGSPEFRIRCPWPLFEYEWGYTREHLLLFPFYERDDVFRYSDHARESRVQRFGWHLVELYDDETRVFPFWVSRTDDSYFRLWPFYERKALDADGETSWRGVLALFPIRWAEAVDRNWAAFWTFYESVECPVYTDHSLFWGLIRWRTYKD